MDQGDFIRHRARPEWGVGQVLRRQEDRIDVQFPHGLVPLKLSIASAHLERVSKSEAAAAKAAAAEARDAAAAAAPKRGGRKKKTVESSG